MKTIAKEYLHINNGGVEFRVVDEGFGPTIQVDATHMGNKTNGMSIHTTKEALKRLAEVFRYASEQDFSKEYVCAAEPIVERRMTKCDGSASLSEVLEQFKDFRMAHPPGPTAALNALAEAKGVGAES